MPASTENVIALWQIAGLVLCVALLYSSVGFGGASVGGQLQVGQVTYLSGN